MRLFCTTFFAVDRTDGVLKEWEGQNVEALTWDEAEKWVKKNKPYLIVQGELESERNDSGDRTYFQPLN